MSEFTASLDEVVTGIHDLCDKYFDIVASFDTNKSMAKKLCFNPMKGTFLVRLKEASTWRDKPTDDITTALRWFNNRSFD